MANEKRLIDLSALGIGERNPNAFNDPERAYGWNDLLKILETVPTVDAVPVVRCRECKYHNKPPCPMRLSFNWTEDDDFCSYGERKDGGE